MLDDLGSLVAKSMVAVDDHPELGSRYRLLETLRAFGQEQLHRAGRLDAGREAHADYYAPRAGSAAHDFYGPDTGRVARQALADAAEYREATGWLMTAGQLGTSLAIAANLAFLGYP